MPAYIGLGKDLLGHLQSSGTINVFRVSAAGDTFENMIFGTAYKRDYSVTPRQIERTLDAIRKHKPQVFLFSGGGNDLTGQQLEACLNHAETGLPILREAYVDFLFTCYFRRGFERLISAVKAARPDIHIFLHGYDYAVPDGRPVLRVAGWSFIGPWFRPALTRKRVLDAEEQKRIISKLLDRFNGVLSDLARRHDKVHHVRLLGTLRAGAGYKSDWANELHPTSRGFKRVAGVFETAVLTAIG